MKECGCYLQIMKKDAARHTCQKHSENALRVHFIEHISISFRIDYAHAACILFSCLGFSVF